MKPLVYRKSKRKRGQPATRRKLHITRGDTVQVISGDDKGKRGKVLRVLPKSGRVAIEGVNVVKRHRRPTGDTPGGIIEFAAPIHHSKVMLVDVKTGEPTRVRRRVNADGSRERIGLRSGQPITRNR